MQDEATIALIARVTEAANAFLQEDLRRSGHGQLVPIYGDVFHVLFLYDRIYMQDLAVRIRRDKSTVTTLVTRLEELGYVRRERCPDDGRRIFVSLTDLGHSLKPQFDRISRRLFQTAFAGISPQERGQLAQILSRVQDNLDAHALFEEWQNVRRTAASQQGMDLTEQASTSYHDKETHMAEWFSGDVITNHIRMHYHRTGGDKPPLILCHGFSDSGLCWTPVARVLQADYDIIMIDARGHGLSEAPESGYTTENMSRDLVGLVEKLGLEQPAVMGHSMGGFVSTLTAADNPGLFRCVVLEDPGWRTPPAPQSQDERDERLNRALEALTANRTRSREELIAACREQSPAWSDDELGPWAESKQQLSPNLAQLYLNARQAWQGLVNRIDCPGLLITADPAKGSIITPEMATEAQSLWEGLQVVHLPAAGHNVRREAYDGFMAAVQAFLAEHGR
jgi:pimeloyl-ACP methyl ester carboxylesterase/DNA-binding MarR family transcriptional regulator